MVPVMLTCVDAIVEHSNVVVRHHIVDETNVYALPLAVGIAQARIDPLGRDLCFADATSMLADLIRNVSEHPQTSAPRTTPPNARANGEPRAFIAARPP
jgi:hypothetical protein